MCCVRSFNLSYESLTGYPVREKLRSLKINDPQFWEELTCHVAKETEDGVVVNKLEAPGEEADLDCTDPSDDTDVSCASVIADMLGEAPSMQVEKLNGGLASKAEAESMDFAVDAAVDMAKHCERQPDEAALGRGRRQKKVNSLYSQKFWRHHDDGEL